MFMRLNFLNIEQVGKVENLKIGKGKIKMAEEVVKKIFIFAKCLK